jgi:hypothetical protein
MTEKSDHLIHKLTHLTEQVIDLEMPTLEKRKVKATWPNRISFLSAEEMIEGMMRDG